MHGAFRILFLIVVIVVVALVSVVGSRGVFRAAVIVLGFRVGIGIDGREMAQIEVLLGLLTLRGDTGRTRPRRLKDVLPDWVVFEARDVVLQHPQSRKIRRHDAGPDQREVVPLAPGILVPPVSFSPPTVLVLARPRLAGEPRRRRQLGPVLAQLHEVVGRRLQRDLAAAHRLARVVVLGRAHQGGRVDVFLVVDQEVVDVHVPVQAGDDDVAELAHPQRVLVPARLVPEPLALGPGRRDVADQDRLHAAPAQELQLHAQPLKLLVSRLRRARAAVDAGVAVEEVHGVDAEDGEPAGHDLDLEPAAELEAVALLLGDEVAPDVGVLPEPLVGPRAQDVVRQDVVVPKVGHHGDAQAGAALVGEQLGEPVGDPPVGPQHLVRVARQLLVAVVAGAVAGPDDEVDLVPEVGRDPVERRIHERVGRVAAGRLGAVDARGAAAPVAGAVLVRGRVRLVERVRVNVCGTAATHQSHVRCASSDRLPRPAARARSANEGAQLDIPVICKNLPCSRLRGAIERSASSACSVSCPGGLATTPWHSIARPMRPQMRPSAVMSII